jgi:Amiloride-sensitive sodium channel
MTSERRERYGPTDFLANCGGFLGLFLGISVISFVEIVYFSTIRLWCTLKKPRKSIIDRTDTIDLQDYRSHSYLKVIKDLIADYSNKTTIQGVNYVADTTLSMIERSWWAILVVISTFCCGSLILDVVESYDQSPIIVSFANEEMHISEV